MWQLWVFKKQIQCYIGILFAGIFVLCVFIIYFGINFSAKEFKEQPVNTDVNRVGKTSYTSKREQSHSQEISTRTIRPPFVTVNGTYAYILSAVSKSKSDKKDVKTLQNVTDTVTVTGWYKPKDKEEHRYKQLSCCLYHVNGSLSSALAERRKLKQSKRDIFDVLQCVCPLHATNAPALKVSIMEADHMCTNNISHYIDVKRVLNREIDGIALCAKIMYGTLNAGYLIEWFEAQRLLGIHKIFCYIHRDLNEDAKAVVKYYQKKKFAEAFTFDIPENDTYPRGIWKGISDQHVVAVDCQEQMSAYKYNVYFDTDEILIPEEMNLKMSLKRYISAVLESNSSLAGVHFKPVMHIKSWGEVDPSHVLVVGKYVNSTLPMLNRKKFAFKPNRVIPASCRTHNCKPKPGYWTKYIQDETAIVHHFRSCPPEWTGAKTTKIIKGMDKLLVKNTHGTICSRFIRHKSLAIQRLAEEIKYNVLKVRSSLNISTWA